MHKAIASAWAQDKKDRKEEVRMFCQLNEPEGDDYSLTYPTDSLNVGGSDLCPKTCKKYWQNK